MVARCAVLDLRHDGGADDDDDGNRKWVVKSSELNMEAHEDVHWI